MESQERIRLRDEGLDWLESGDEIVILDTDRSVYMSINATGALLWRLLRDGATIIELAGALATTYKIDPVRAQHDAEDFVVSLRSQGLLRD